MASTACVYGNPEDCFGVQLCHHCKGKEMGFVQNDGRVLYGFNGQDGKAQHDALCTVFTQENIPFESNVTPDCHAVTIAPEYGIRAREAVTKWTTAMHVVHHVVWYD